MIDPVTLAVLRGRLEQISDEMDATLFRSAFNPIIAEAHDASHGIYDARTGETLVQGKSGLPIFVGVMAFGVKAVIDKFGAGVQPGDVFVFNEPYAGGTHVSDVRLVRPHFRNGELFCWLASVGHYHDVGGPVPGNYNPAATEVLQEGFLLPPVRLVAGGEFRQDISDILLANSRQPLSAYGDLNGQLAALELGARRLDELLDAYGDATVAEALGELRARAARQMRAIIAALPEGTWRAEDFLDNDGRRDTPLKIALTVTIKGGAMTWDFSGSAAACEGPVNISHATTVAACYVALKHLFPEVPANAGVLEPLNFIVPEGSILNATPPRPTAGYTETILRLIDVVFSAFDRVAPGTANAHAYGTINALSLAGTRADGRRWVMFSFFGGGHGGNPEGDGLNHGNAPISTATIPPVEVLEAAYPVMFTQWALRENSGGKGEHRGGLGAVYEIELLEANAEAFLFGERARFAPRGAHGGGPGAANSFRYQQDDGWHEPPMASKMVGIRLSRGQRVRLETPGGGGWGDPARRAPEAIARDIRLGYAG
jgi:N-methylhydantoinase B